MKKSYKRIAIFFFTLLLIVLLFSKTEHKICTVCGVQDFNRSLFGKQIELISSREVDEYGTHKKWKILNGKAHKPHMWMAIKETNRDLLK